MSASSVMKNTLPGIDGATEGQLGRREVALAERKGPKPAILGEKSPTEHDMTETERQLMAALFDAAVKAWGGTDAVASFLGIHKSNVSRMQSGEKTVAFKHLLALLDDSAEVILAVCQVQLARINYVARPADAPTFARVSALVTRKLADGSVVGRSIIDNATKDSGWTPEQVSMALRGEGDSE
jgi:hypothetical protein